MKFSKRAGRDVPVYRILWHEYFKTPDFWQVGTKNVFYFDKKPIPYAFDIFDVSIKHRVK